MGESKMISKKVEDNLQKSSWIRAMFEQGMQLKKQFGEENVFDFSLGNPDPEPSEGILATMESLVRVPGIHKYMSNAGFQDVREKVAEHASNESQVEVTANHVVMVNGAAGGLNVVLKSILNPGDEVIVIAPYFSEYKFYTENHGGVVVPVPAQAGSFNLDVEAIKNAITDKTKAIILNSPNNPTGTVYDEKTLNDLSNVLDGVGHAVYVISDEPYAKIVYDGVCVPVILKIFKNSIVINSFSKSLALPGERIGFCIVSPNCEDVNLLLQAMIFANRTLGFVNAPSLMQRVIAEHLDEVVGLEEYKAKRDALYDVLVDAGFECRKPEGAFYMFPKSPIPDDSEFAKEALKYNIVLVGGTGFGYPGYLRLSYCISMDTIVNSRKAFKELMKKYR
jgi:aspartate aminotransferase